jgi:hypothetical protein
LIAASFPIWARAPLTAVLTLSGRKPNRVSNLHDRISDDLNECIKGGSQAFDCLRITAGAEPASVYLKCQCVYSHNVKARTIEADIDPGIWVQDALAFRPEELLELLLQLVLLWSITMCFAAHTEQNSDHWRCILWDVIAEHSTECLCEVLLRETCSCMSVQEEAGPATGQ